MKTLRWTEANAAETADEAAAMLEAGGLVALPTETVYGLAARADSAAACARIFHAKGRPATHPLIVHVASVDAAMPLVAAEARGTLARWGERFWPGPLTLVLPRSAAVPALVAAGGATVALRVSAHPIMAAVLARCAFGVAAPSANRYQSVSPTRASHVLRTLEGRIDMLVDGGPSALGLESTIVAPALAGAEHSARTRVLRLGGLALEELRSFDASLVVDAGIEGDAATHEAPGRDRKHYAPRCAIAFVESAEGLPGREESIGYLTYGEALPASLAFARALPSDPQGYGRELFDALHGAEASGVTTLYVRRVPTDDAWAAVRDRLTRAAAR